MTGCFNRSVLARPDDVPPVPPSLGANATRISANALLPAAHMCHSALERWESGCGVQLRTGAGRRSGTEYSAPKQGAALKEDAASKQVLHSCTRWQC